MEANTTASSSGDTYVWDDPSTLSDAEVARLLRRLEGDEKSLSRRRSVLHDRIDFVGNGVTSEIYAAADQLEALRQRERKIAEERRLLHDRIDSLRAEQSRRRAAGRH